MLPATLLLLLSLRLLLQPAAAATIQVGVLSLDAQASSERLVAVDERTSWPELHDELISLFPRHLTDRFFHLRHLDTGEEAESLSQLVEGARFVVDDTRPAAWLRDLACKPKAVTGQYHKFAYPHRDSDEEAARKQGGKWAASITLSTGSAPIEINHYIYHGRRNMASSPFRMLVAGGGTGDATLTAALGFAALENFSQTV